MDKPTILRKRYIPDEVIDISGDELLYRDEDLIVTRWVPIKPRKDISKGVSCIYLKEGYKISKFYNNGTFAYWYCDIIEIEYDRSRDKYLLKDLLVDVKILPDRTVQVLDMGELAEALENRLITAEQGCSALKKLDRLLNMIYSGNFPPEAFEKLEAGIIK